MQKVGERERKKIIFSFKYDFDKIKQKCIFLLAIFMCMRARVLETILKQILKNAMQVYG